MGEVWAEVQTSDKLQKIVGQKSGSLHAIYHNVTPTGFDMIIGFWVDETISQSEGVTILEVPEQNYKFGEFDFTGPESVGAAWSSINMIPKIEIPRTMKFDLEMYAEDMKKFWIAVGV